MTVAPGALNVDAQALPPRQFWDEEVLLTEWLRALVYLGQQRKLGSREPEHRRGAVERPIEGVVHRRGAVGTNIPTRTAYCRLCILHVLCKFVAVAHKELHFETTRVYVHYA